MNRRDFLKTSALATAGAATVPHLAFAGKDTGKVTLVIDPGDAVASAPASGWAVGRLREALQAAGILAQKVARLEDVPAKGRVVLVSGSSAPGAGRILKSQGLPVVSKPESLVLTEGRAGEGSVLLVCGSDPRGLVYALLELADRVRIEGTSTAALAVPRPVLEEPSNPVRGIYRCFVSELQDKPWFYDREGWRPYLDMLATHRINRFSLMLGMGYNTPRNVKDSYFFFAYPFLLAVPGYEVRMGNLPDAERDRNLEMLRFISEQTVARGLHFQLGLWSHGRNWPNSADVNYPLLGVTAKNHGPYCRDALAALLEACPAIGGVTLRVHGESGVPEGEYGFWETLFEAFGRCGRKVGIDMHAKNVTQRMIEIAVGTGMPVTLSPKYWAEHQGLGYIQAAIRAREMRKKAYKEEPSGVGLGSRSFTRYGYGDYFKEDRPYGILHRVWPGTQRLLLSGDPVLSAAYGRVSGFCGGLGFDLLDPLTFKGRTGSGHPGSRCAYADSSLVPKYDWQKFDYTYRVWGRLAYNPETDADGWRRLLRREFGGGAEAAEKALASASRVLTLVTTAHGPSPDCFVYWPEIYTNLPIVTQDRGLPRGKVARETSFGSVSPFDPQLFMAMDEYADALLAGQEPHRYTPIEVAQKLEDLAASTTANLARAGAAVADRTRPGYRRLVADVKIQAGLGRFFAAKMRSAVLWRIHERTGDGGAGAEAVAAYRRARDAWARMAEGAKGIYVTDISFGSRPGIRGCWMDRLAAINDDLGAMEHRLAASKPSARMEEKRWRIGPAVQAALAHPLRRYAGCAHVPRLTFRRGKAFPIEISAPAGTHGVSLYYRHVNQALRWRMLRMNAEGQTYRGIIPADYTRTNFPLQYYFAVELESGPAIHPGLDENFMNQPYYVVRLDMSCVLGD